MNNSSRVIVNTGFLYINMLITLIVQLVAVRLVLNALGQTDYGIYTLVAGVVAMFAFMNIAMAAATQRYLSYAIGQGQIQEIKNVFYYSIILHSIIGILVLIILEVGGTYYILNWLKAPADRIETAKTLLHCITASTLINILTVPYEADLNARENMGIIALLNILDSLMKLGTAIFIGYITSDRLLVYGILTMTTMIITLLLKRQYCKKHYIEAHFKIRIIQKNEWKKIKSMTFFALWNLIGSGCSIARYQGTAMILNLFWGILINTAYGISQQVNGLLNFFANTIVRAIRPQITKSEGSGHHQRMLQLSETTCKITSLMVAILAIPLFIEMKFILQLWLHQQVSPECIMFCRAFIVIVFINQLTIGLQIALESVGRIRTLQTIVGSMHIISLPLGYICLKFGFPAYSIMLCIIAEEIICIGLRTIIAHLQAGLAGKKFIFTIVLPCIFLVVCVWGITETCHQILSHNLWLRLICTSVLSTVLLCSISYKMILTTEERNAIDNFIFQLTKKIKR